MPFSLGCGRFSNGLIEHMFIRTEKNRKTFQLVQPKSVLAGHDIEINLLNIFFSGVVNADQSIITGKRLIRIENSSSLFTFLSSLDICFREFHLFEKELERHVFQKIASNL